MAVYFEPERRRGRHWTDYLEDVVSQVLGHGLERNRNAQQYELGQRAEQEAMHRRQAERDMSGEAVRNIGGRGGFDPSNPQAYQEGLLELGARYPHMSAHIPSIAQQAAPHHTFQNVDLGGEVAYGGFNPRGGETGGMVTVPKRLTPDLQYAQDVMTRRTKMAEEGASARSAANLGFDYEQLRRQRDLDRAVRDAYGEALSPGSGEGSVERTETPGLRPAQKEGAVGARLAELYGLRERMLDPHGRRPLPGMEQRVRQIDDELYKLLAGATPQPHPAIGYE